MTAERHHPPHEEGCADCAQAASAEYLRYLMNRGNLAAMLRIRAAEAITAVDITEKALAAGASMDGGTEADIGDEADDALTDLRAAAHHLRNALRIAIGHERDIRDEIAAAAKEANLR
jgi:hypothetical protein